MHDNSLKTTPLLEKHKDLGAKLAPFGGWLMPIQYEGIIAEHNWTRSSCSLFDICHMGEFALEGEAKNSNLSSIVTTDVDSMKPAQCRYGFMLNKKGGVIDDVIVYKIKNDKWMIVVNAATIEKDEKHLRSHASDACVIKNKSKETAKLDLQGPLSAEVIKTTLGLDVSGLKYYQFSQFNMLGQDSIISRTGYTGELGYELYISAKKAGELWDTLLKDERVKPAGLGARDTLRLEMGYSLYGQDIDEDITPLEAGLEKFIDFNKDFIGKPALLKQKQNPVSKKRVYFISSSRRSPRHNYKIFSDGAEIGIVTSGSYSPSLSCGIGMGYVESGYDKIDTKIILKDEKTELGAVICNRPFYKKGAATIA